MLEYSNNSDNSEYCVNMSAHKRDNRRVV